MAPRIRKLYSYLQAIETIEIDDDTCYRGQRDQWPIIPKIARIDPRSKLEDDERRMVEVLWQQIPQFVTDVPDNEWDLLAIAQHHGMATRLLDWTYNPLAALWFAVREPSIKPTVGVVWIFRPGEDDLVSDLATSSPFDSGRSRLFVPNHVSPRIRAQAGLFSVQKPARKHNKFVPFEQNRFTKDNLEKIEIESGYFSHLRYELDLCGINHASMFPDLDGLCSHLTWKNSLSNDE